MRLKNLLHTIQNEKSLILFINKNKISGPLWYKNPIKINRTLTPMYVIKKKIRWKLPNNFYINQTSWFEPFIKQKFEKFIFKNQTIPTKDNFFETNNSSKLQILFLKNIAVGWMFLKKWGFKWFRLKRTPLPHYKLYIAVKMSTGLPECKLRYYGFQNWGHQVNFEKRFNSCIFLIRFYTLELKESRQKKFSFILSWHYTQVLIYFLPGLPYKLFFRYLKEWPFFFTRYQKYTSFFNGTKYIQHLISSWILILTPYWPLQNEIANKKIFLKKHMEKKRILEQKKFLNRWQHQTWAFFYKKSFYSDGPKKFQYYWKRLRKKFKYAGELKKIRRKVAEWSKALDCKSIGYYPHRFKSYLS